MTKEPIEAPLHPFQRTLGDGPYRFVGMFYINLEAGKLGRNYINKHEVHPKFVRGAGTCAHCGHAILNVCQVQIGNGEVYGVGTDCIEKAGLPVRELSKVEKAKRDHNKSLAKARKARKGDTAREAIKQLIDSQGRELCAKPHPYPHMADQKYTLFDYAEWVLEKSNGNGIVYALARIKTTLK